MAYFFNKLLFVLFSYVSFSIASEVVEAEIFWDDSTSHTSVLFQNGSVDFGLTQIIDPSVSLPSEAGDHILNIRVMGLESEWGPSLQIPIQILEERTPQNMRISQARYFWDNNKTQAYTLLAQDGNFNEALETLWNSGLQFPDSGLHTFHLQVQGSKGEWGAEHISPVIISSTATESPFQIQKARYYWNDISTGVYALNSITGNWQEAIQTVIHNNMNLPEVGRHILNLQVMDAHGEWGSAYQIPILLQDNQSSLQIIEARAFWGSDSNSAISLLAQDNQFNQALENLLHSTFSSNLSGKHILSIQVKDGNGVWGAVFKTPILLEEDQEQFQIQQARLYWNQDVNTSQNILAQDGNIDEVLEVFMKTNLNLPINSGDHLLNVQVMGSNQQWGPVFQYPVQITKDSMITLVKVQALEVFCGNDPGAGSATPFVSLVGDNGIQKGGLSSFENLLISGSNICQIRAQSHDGSWGSTYKSVFHYYEDDGVHVQVVSSSSSLSSSSVSLSSSSLSSSSIVLSSSSLSSSSVALSSSSLSSSSIALSSSSLSSSSIVLSSSSLSSSSVALISSSLSSSSVALISSSLSISSIVLSSSSLSSSSVALISSSLSSSSVALISSSLSSSSVALSFSSELLSSSSEVTTILLQASSNLSFSVRSATLNLLHMHFDDVSPVSGVLYNVKGEEVEHFLFRSENQSRIVVWTKPLLVGAYILKVKQNGISKTHRFVALEK